MVDGSEVNIVPQPVEVVGSPSGALCVPVAGGVDVVCEFNSFRPAAELIAGWISKRCSVTCTAAASGDSPGPGIGGDAVGGRGDVVGGGDSRVLRCVRLVCTAPPQPPTSRPIAAAAPAAAYSTLESEAYSLKVADGEAVIAAAMRAGATRGAATLLQLVRPAGDGAAGWTTLTVRGGLCDALTSATAAAAAAVGCRGCPAWQWPIHPSMHLSRRHSPAQASRQPTGPHAPNAGSRPLTQNPASVGTERPTAPPTTTPQPHIYA